ncbi:MAG TPA: c-type cytochrome [Acetobacteraceae bacterium]|nr:c-type cytochrome [Acetobacteraceae bacterium]
MFRDCRRLLAGPVRSGLLALSALAAASGAGPALAEPAAGAAIAANGTPSGAPACASCHGAGGEGNIGAGIPRLAGLPAPYTTSQLTAFANGQRDNPLMTPIARTLSRDEAEAVAVYYAALPGHALPSGAPPSAGAGSALALEGRWSDGIPACVACHGPDGIGVGADFPPIAGQPASYVTAQLEAWRQGKRPPGPLGLMEAVARRLTPSDITALAEWVATLSGGVGPTAPDASAHEGASLAPSAPSPVKPGTEAVFQPPPESAIPAGPYGDMVKLGRDIFRDTRANASAFVGNALRCGNCHLDAGRLANAAPLWAAWVAFPAYRAKTREVNTFQERLQGCFRFSMNGTAPPLGDDVLVALETYSAWLARGAPVGADMPGRSYPRLGAPPSPPDYARGQVVYQQKCALCHGAGGAGQSAPAGTVVFPPLWGPTSYNWGAGMEMVDTAAAFIKANMPLGLGGTLSDQQAWDVALFLDSHERPQDPRFAGTVGETRRRFHDSPWSMYGRTVAGRVLGGAAQDERAGEGTPERH